MNREPDTATGITKELQAKCDADNQFERFDNLFRQVVSVPKYAIDKEAAKQKKAKGRRKS